MASATVGPTPTPDRLSLESIPTVDLRLLTQSELNALSLCSSHAFDLRRCDDVVIPKIDRSVFNESAGSRKQTYSRLRLAPRNKPNLAAAAPYPNPDPPPAVSHSDRAENSRIIGLFKNLFHLSHGIVHEDGNKNKLALVGDDDELSMQLVPVNVSYCASLRDTVPGPVNHEILVIDGNKKRKRGVRKSKNEMVSVSPSTFGGVSSNTDTNTNILSSSSAIEVAVVSEANEEGGEHDEEEGVKNVVLVDEEEEKRKAEERERELVNKNGVSVDLAALAKLEDPYGEELLRQTEGKTSVEELLEFVRNLEGDWGSRRKKRKVVDANVFGDALPNGWKVLLAIKKKQGRAWVFCRRYISPNGRYFMSCKEVSSYLLSLTGRQELNEQSTVHDAIIPVGDSMASENAVQIETKVDHPSSSVASQPNDLGSEQMQLCIYQAVEQEKQLISSKDTSTGEVQAASGLKCHKCSTPFSEKDELLNHLVSCHKRKRRKSGIPIEEDDLVKDGKYECQFCNKIFLERNSYFGHVGIHVKNYVRSIGGSPGLTNKQKITEKVPVGEVPVTPSVSPILTDPNATPVTGTPNTLSNNELLKDSKISAAFDTEQQLDYGYKVQNSVACHTSLNIESAQDNKSSGGQSCPLHTADDSVMEEDKFSNVEPDDFSGSDNLLVTEDNDLYNGPHENSATDCVASKAVKSPAFIVESAEACLFPDSNLEQENSSDLVSMHVMDGERLPSKCGLLDENGENTSRDRNSGDVYFRNRAVDQYFHGVKTDGLTDGTVSGDFDDGMDAADVQDTGNLEECSATPHAEEGSYSGTVSKIEHVGSSVSDLKVDGDGSTLSAGQQALEMRNNEGQDFTGLANETDTGLCSFGDTVVTNGVDRGITLDSHSENSLLRVSRDYGSSHIGKEAVSASDVEMVQSTEAGGFQVEQSCSPEDSTQEVPVGEKEDDKCHQVLNIDNPFFSSGTTETHLDVDALTNNDQSHTDVSNLLGVFGSFDEDKQEQVPKSILTGLSMNEDNREVAVNDVVNVSSSTTRMHLPGFEKAESSRPNKLVPNFGHMRGMNERFLSPAPHDSAPQVSSPFQLWGQQSCGFEDSHTKVYGVTRGVAQQERASDNSSLNLVGLQQPSDTGYNLNEVCMNEQNYVRHAETGVFSRSNEVRRETISHSNTLNLAGFQQQCDTGYNLNKPCINQPSYGIQHRDARTYNTQDEARQERVAYGNSLSLASVQQTCDTRYSLNKAGVQQTCDSAYSLNKGYIESIQGMSKLDEVGHSRDRDLMIGFGSNSGRSNQAASTGYMWRPSKVNILPGGLVDSSSSQAQSSGSFQAFDFLSDKGGNDLYSANEKFGNNMSSFDGLRSNVEPMEFSFLTTQESNAQMEHPKALQYNTGMDQGFGPNLWNQKAASLPNMMAGHVVNIVCVWCGNEFHQDPLACEMQAGSIGFLCPTCKTRMSGQFL